MSISRRKNHRFFVSQMSPIETSFDSEKSLADLILPNIDSKEKTKVIWKDGSLCIHYGLYCSESELKPELCVTYVSKKGHFTVEDVITVVSETYDCFTSAGEDNLTGMPSIIAGRALTPQEKEKFDKGQMSRRELMTGYKFLGLGTDHCDRNQCLKTIIEAPVVKYVAPGFEGRKSYADVLRG